MGFFDKFKQKITEKVEQFTEKVNKVGDNISTQVSTVVEKTTNVVEKASETIAEVVKITPIVQFNKLKEGLSKTRSSLSKNILGLLGGGRKIDDKLLDEIEEALILADIGVKTTQKIIARLKLRVKEDKLELSEHIYATLKEEIYNLLIKSPSADNDRIYAIDSTKKPHTILVIGVNGVGKTTTIGKLAYNYKNAGNEVVIGAADTFRAAANEQLEIWSQRAGVDIIQRGHGADPASVAYDTIHSAASKNKDVVIIDTAGRLHNKANLMQELEKMSRVMKKVKESAPDDVYLVLDATTGQNAIQQAKEFMKVAKITGIVLTKLDGTAKGGVVIPIADELQIPVRYIGVGEQINDLQVFDPTFFVEALFGDDKDGSETNIDNLE